MTDAEKNYAAYAGLVVFPRNPTDLVSTTTCPACFTLLTSPVCSVCGLDVVHPAALELASLSADAAQLLERRLDLIGRIRYDTAHAYSPVEAATSVPASAAPPIAQAVARPIAPATPLPNWREPEPSSTTPRRVPRRSSVQVIVLIVGVALLSIAAIFFLVYAFIAYGILVRSIIIGAITVAAFVVASILKRRKLRTTAEGIAVFAAVLVYLDAYAVRANNLFEAQSSNVQLYWGLTLVISSVVLLAWNRLSRLRVPSIVGFAALAPGLGLIAGGFGSSLEGTTRGYLIVIVTAAAGLANPLAGRWAKSAPGSSRGRIERVLMLVTSTISLLIAFGLAFAIEQQTEWASTVALLVVAVIGFAHVVVGSRLAESRAATGLTAVLAGTGAVAVALIGIAVPLRFTDFDSFLIWPPLVAVPIALLLEAALRRVGSRYWKIVLRTAAVCVGVVAVLSVIAPTAVAVGATVAAASRVAHPWAGGPFEVIGIDGSGGLQSVAVLAILGFVAAAIWFGFRMRRTPVLLWVGAALLILAVPLLRLALPVVLAWLALGVLAVAASIFLRRRGGAESRLPSALVGLIILGTTLGYLASWTSIGTWAYGSAAAVVVLLGSRWAVRPRNGVLRAALLVPATFVVLIGAAALTRQLTGNPPSSVNTTLDALNIVAIVAAAIVVISVAVPRVTTLDRRVLFWLALASAIAAASSGWLNRTWFAGADEARRPAAFVVGLVLLAALAVVLLARRSLEFALERICAAALVAPVVLLVVDTILRLTSAGSFIASIEAFATVLLVAAAILALELVPAARARDSAIPRWAGEIGIALVAVPSTVWVLGTHPTSTWLALVLLGVTFLLLAISSDGLFGSRSPRRHLGWLALALGTVGLWWRLGGDRVVPIEPYVLPLAGALLIIAALVDRAARRSQPQGRAAPLVALGGLLVGVLPLALVSSSGDIVRPLAVGLVSAALLGIGAFVRPRSAATRDYLSAAALVGGLGVLVVGVGRALAQHLADGTESGQADVWIAVAFVVVVVGAVGYARPVIGDGIDAQNSARSIAAQVAVVAALAAVMVAEGGSIASGPLGRGRALVVVLLFSAIHVLALWYVRSPLTRFVGWISLALGVVIAGIGLTARAFSPFELGTTPIAIALVASGAIYLARTPAARSWQHIGPGLLVLFVPSLLATHEDRPIWRLVALGVVAVAAIVVGVAWRLQAPFVLGVIVALIHGIATFAEQIRNVYEAVPWWLWLGIGGILLILLAARYEKRIQNLRNVAMRVGSLR